MLKIGDNLAAAIEEMERSNLELAFRHVCVALDQTAKKHFQKNLSNKSDYKNLIQEYYWVLELTVLPGLNLDETKFGNLLIYNGDKLIKQPNFSDIVYHVIRCGLLHDDGIPSNIQFSEENSIFCDQNLLQLPKNLIWGLIKIIIFCHSNHDEKIERRYWIDVLGNRLHINDFFGVEIALKNIYEKNVSIGSDGKPLKVAIILSKGHSSPISAGLKCK